MISARLVIVGGLGLALSACSFPPPQPDYVGATALPVVAPPQEVIESIEPWSFGGAPGEVIRTPHYRIFTTEGDAILIDRLPAFLEAALTHYRIAITPLPPPRLRLDTYLMDTRPQWARLTQQLLGAESEQFTRIQRGGFATRGIGVFFDIGVFDTLAVAAHEGWHQYTQRTFAERLPVWLEEGVATFMEGHKWDGGRAMFLPWANVERYDQLRTAHAKRALLPLEDLLATAPQEKSAASGDALVTYYAQVWALVHFLNEGESRAYRGALSAILTDAAEGRLRRSLLVGLGREAGATAITTGRGAGALKAYIEADMAELSAQYDAFVARIVAPGARDLIVSGRSPLEGRR